jgi:hypothetical protein
MKSLTVLAILAVFLIIGCTDTPIAPIKSDNQSVHLIKLPPKAGLSVENEFSVTKTINGDDGGTIKIKESYVAEDGHTVKIDVKLKINKNSYSGEETITMTVDDDYAAVWFTPHMVFSESAKLDVKFEGINLEELELLSGDYDFVFIPDSDPIEEVECSSIQVQESNGKISVKKAKLNHFSRYAFTR